jgi:DNA-binding transcriptional MerR regulator
MEGVTISQAAARTGFPATTLRFYEDVGIVRPARSSAGYRLYDDADLQRLAFVARAKRFGLTLDEIAELIPLVDDGRCAPVQERLRMLVAAKVADARIGIADLEAFLADLERVAAGLDRHTPDGPCDDGCGCRADPSSATPVPIACTLAPDVLDDRVGRWREVVAGAVAVDAVAGGHRLRFEERIDVAALVELVAAEQQCCAFLTFRITLRPGGVELEVLGPSAARPVIDTLVGA